MKEKLTEDREGFKAQKKKYDKLLREAHTKYLSDLISDNSNDPKSLFKLIDSIVSNSKENILPDQESEIELAGRFNEYFMEQVFVIHKNLKGLRTTSNSYTEEIRKYQVAMTYFRETSEDDVVHLSQYQHGSYINVKLHSHQLSPELPTLL